MSNKSSRDAFRKNERIIKYLISVIVAFSFILLAVGISDYADKHYRYFSLSDFLLLWATKNLILFLLNVGSGVALLVVLRKQYNFEY